MDHIWSYETIGWKNYLFDFSIFTIGKLKAQQVLAWSDFNKLKGGGSTTAPEKEELRQKRTMIEDIVKRLELENEEDKDFGKALDALTHIIGGYDNDLDDLGTIKI